MKIKRFIFTFTTIIATTLSVAAQTNETLSSPSSELSVFLRSQRGYKGTSDWRIKKVTDVKADGAVVSKNTFRAADWYPAIVPGTVLNTLVDNKVYPEPYFGDNNRKTNKLIPDISVVGREFYHYWFRTEFAIPQNFRGKHVWLKLHGINYRCNIWVNGKQFGSMAGMFNAQSFDISSVANFKAGNVLAVDVSPIDVTGSNNPASQKRPGAIGENNNGGDRMIGKNVTMLMSVGWDFTLPDGVRDRNTGIWRDVEIYATGDVVLESPFIQTKLPLPDTLSSKQTVSVEVLNVTSKKQIGVVQGTIAENNVRFEKEITLLPNERKTVVFTPEEYKQLVFQSPKLWWPINKGKQNLYTLELKFINRSKAVSHSISTRFGVREITSDQNTPDHSRRFVVNGHPVFIRGTNWVPDAMLRNSEKRLQAELRYTRQAGVNLLRLWAGGTTESDYFYKLCDEYGFLVWNEYWITGDCLTPTDTTLYFKNIENTVKRERNHPSLAYYVLTNEAREYANARTVFQQLDGTRGYQEQSECCGVHDGSPYLYVNPMQYYENTASARGSRVDGFNPEYGTPCLPTLESLKEMMPEKDLWPINDSVWNYMDGGGFHKVTTLYKQAVDKFGVSNSIAEFAKKAQFIGAMNYRAIWEVWNYNKFNFGDRFCSGFLFWYHNSSNPQVAGRMYDWSLEPTAALYYSQNGLAPLHPQFDYLKNTVSVYNDYRTSFANYNVIATVYDFDSKKVLTLNKNIDIPADGVVNDALKIDFPTDISQVHFIKLELKDEKGKLVGDAFYWRSNDAYKGVKVLSGPTTGGFESLNKLPHVNLDVREKHVVTENKLLITIVLRNSSGTLAFFNQLKLVDGNGRSIKPAFYSDNFFTLLPGESKMVTIEVDKEDYSNKQIQLVVDGWNASETRREIIVP